MDETKSYYAVIPANVRYDKNIPDKAKLLYGEITALCNEKGFCWASNEYFANLYDVRKETISRLVSSLEKNGYIYVHFRYKEGTKAIDSRCISLSPPIDREINTYCEKSQEPHDKKVKRGIDENVKDNNTVFNNTTNSIKDTVLFEPFDIKRAFESFWSAYPKKVNKKKAQDKFLKICKSDVKLKKILEGLKVYKSSKEWRKDNGQFIPHPTTWLNGERWNDEVCENVSNENQLPEWYYNQDSVKLDIGEVDEMELERLMKQLGGEQND